MNWASHEGNIGLALSLTNQVWCSSHLLTFSLFHLQEPPRSSSWSLNSVLSLSSVFAFTLLLMLSSTSVSNSDSSLLRASPDLTFPLTFKLCTVFNSVNASFLLSLFALTLLLFARDLNFNWLPPLSFSLDFLTYFNLKYYQWPSWPPVLDQSKPWLAPFFKFINVFINSLYSLFSSSVEWLALFLGAWPVLLPPVVAIGTAFHQSFSTKVFLLAPLFLYFRLLTVILVLELTNDLLRSLHLLVTLLSSSSTSFNSLSFSFLCSISISCFNCLHFSLLSCTNCFNFLTLPSFAYYCISSCNCSSLLDLSVISPSSRNSPSSSASMSK